MCAALLLALLFEVLGRSVHTTLPGLRRQPQTADDFRTGETLPGFVCLGQSPFDGHDLLLDGIQFGLFVLLLGQLRGRRSRVG